MTESGVKVHQSTISRTFLITGLCVLVKALQSMPVYQKVQAQSWEGRAIITSMFMEISMNEPAPWINFLAKNESTKGLAHSRTNRTPKDWRKCLSNIVQSPTTH